MKARDVHLPARWIFISGTPCAANWVAPPILLECNAYCAESRPLLSIISLNAATASVRVNVFQPCDVRLTINDDLPGSNGCAASRSSSASKAPINTGTSPGSPGYPAFVTRVLVIVHPALFGWSSTPPTAPVPSSRSLSPRTRPGLLLERK